MTFNWHENRDSFKGWMVITVIPRDGFEELSDATDKFIKVDVDMTINGIEVDAEAFLDGVERNMKANSKIYAVEMIRDNQQLSSLMDELVRVQGAVKAAVRNALKDTELAEYYSREDEGW